MGSVYRAAEGKLVLYAQEGRIFLRTLTRDSMGRAIILTTDYGSDLTDVLYRGTVYYAYKNTEGDILIKNIVEHGVQYRLGAEGGPVSAMPKLTVVGETLLLFYAVRNPVDGQYGLRCQLPFGKENEREEMEQRIGSFLREWAVSQSEPPRLQVMSGVGGILLFLDRKQFAWLGEDWQWTLLRDAHGTQEELSTEPQEDSEKIFAQRLQQARQQWEAETAKEEKQWAKELEHCQKELSQRDLLIESIKQQYEELMEVAEKYREEAIKWRSKFIR